MITLLAIGVLGGNENTEYFVLSVSAEAKPARSVEMADISPPLNADRDKAQASRELSRGVCYPSDKEMENSHQW